MQAVLSQLTIGRGAASPKAGASMPCISTHQAAALAAMQQNLVEAERYDLPYTTCSDTAVVGRALNLSLEKIDKARNTCGALRVNRHLLCRILGLSLLLLLFDMQKLTPQMYNNCSTG